jgi:hypothetical protein
MPQVGADQPGPGADADQGGGAHSPCHRRLGIRDRLAGVTGRVLPGRSGGVWRGGAAAPRVVA